MVEIQSLRRVYSNNGETVVVVVVVVEWDKSTKDGKRVDND